MKKFVRSFLITSLIIGQALAGSLSWYGFWTGESIAKQQNKPLLVYVFQEDCEYCEQMSATTLQSPFVLNYIKNHFVASYANLSTHRGRIVGREYIVLGTPTTLFVNPNNGSVFYRVYGIEGPTSFFESMRQACKIARKDNLQC